MALALLLAPVLVTTCAAILVFTGKPGRQPRRAETYQQEAPCSDDKS
ncbi:hypothetical protein [Phenylobacterium sp.]